MFIPVAKKKVSTYNISNNTSRKNPF